MWVPQFIDRRPYEVWEKARDGAREWAQEKARWILAHHRPDPLDDRLAAEIRHIIATAETRA